VLLVTAEEMRELDRRTIEGGVLGLTLMERAGAGVVEIMARRYGPLLGMRVLVLAGPGNNGGDGLVAARHLREGGATVSVGLLSAPDRLRGDARAQWDRAQAEHIDVTAIASENELRALWSRQDRWDFALDAVLGTGARGGLEGILAAGVQLLREMDEAGTRVVAVDLPTGLDADTGGMARRAVRADLTVTFGVAKRGHLLYPGRAFVGQLDVVDIGLLDATAARTTGDPATMWRTEIATAAELSKHIPARDPRAHKNSAGRVAVIGGSEGMTGAMALAAHAATRAGAGYVLAGVPASLMDVFAIKLTEELPRPLPEHESCVLGPESVTPALALAETAHAVVMGPGLSRAPSAEDFALRFVESCARPLVLDADGLNAVAGATEPFAKTHAPIVVTPHLGEMSRLTGIEAHELDLKRIDAAREWAARWNVIVVLKGAPTVTAAPDGRATVNPTGNSGMATAGMGDVLSGAIAALIAQGCEPYDAARAAVWAHGEAGDRAAREIGARGICASDVMERLPRALDALVA
jgi:NAD(P)H-hydrate epimerase